MLKRFIRWLWPQDAASSSAGHRDTYITREEVLSLMEKFEQRQEFELGEWFDKFSALHARTEKRAQRDKIKQGSAPVAQEQQPSMPSVLAYRKPWSV